jgi:hypothetical protein
MIVDGKKIAYIYRNFNKEKPPLGLRSYLLILYQGLSGRGGLNLIYYPVTSGGTAH